MTESRSGLCDQVELGNANCPESLLPRSHGEVAKLEFEPRSAWLQSQRMELTCPERLSSAGGGLYAEWLFPQGRHRDTPLRMDTLLAARRVVSW